MITELHTIVEHIADVSRAGTGKSQAGPAVDQNWIQECMDQDQRQENRQSPSGILAMKEENVIPIISQL